MMKKLLVLMLVLCMASLANATVVYRYTSDSAGTTTITEVLTDTTFYLVIGGLVADFPQNIKIYDPFENVPTGPTDFADFKAGVTLVDNGNGYDAAGNMATVYYDSSYDGIEIIADQAANTIDADDAIDGDWAIFELLSLAEGTFDPDLVDSAWLPIAKVLSIEIIPEPMTLALLGLGGLFLRRRKA